MSKSSTATLTPITQDNVTTRLNEIPALPAIVYDLHRLINDPMSSAADAEKALSSDANLSSKVLALLNSAYYAIPGGVNSLSRAIAFTGFDTVNQLVLCASIVDALKLKGPQAFDLNQFWQHSVGAGIIAETLAKHVNHPTPSDLFTCGFAHDIGKVVLYILQPELVLKTSEIANYKHILYCDAENEIGAVSHTRVGQLVAQKWNLPSALQQTIALHHVRDVDMRGGLSTEVNRNIDLVLLGNLLAHAMKFGNSGHRKVLGAPTDVVERIGLKPEKDLKPLLEEIKISLTKAADFWRVLCGAVK